MGRILKPLVRGGGWYPSKKWIPLVKNGGYTTQNGGDNVNWTKVSGVSPLSLPNALAHFINSLRQIGKCTVSGTDITCNNGVLKYDSELGVYADGTPEEIRVTGKNLFDLSFLEFDDTTYAHVIELNSSADARAFVSALSKFVGKQLVYSAKIAGTTSGVAIGQIRLVNSSSLNLLSFNPGTAFTVTDIFDSVDKVIIYGSSNSQASASELQIELGSTATEYEEYHQETATASNLFAVGSVTDEQDIISGTITRRCEAVVSDGTTPSGRYIGTVGDGNILVCAKETGYSGAIASFTADKAEPLSGLVAQINPVQDLHGQDAPYPAGGGKQLIPYPYFDGNSKTVNGVTFTVSSDGVVTANGTATDNAEFALIAGAYALPSGTYTISGLPSGAGNSSFVFNTYAMDAGNNILFDFRTSVNRTETVTSDIARLHIYIRIISGYTANNLVFKPMFEAGSTASSWQPYANLCPISGWTGVEGKRTGKNLCPRNTIRTEHNGINYTVTNDGIRVHGTATGASYSWGGAVAYDDCWIHLPAGMYRFSVTDMFGSNQQDGYITFIGVSRDGTNLGNLATLNNQSNSTRSKSYTLTEDIGIYYGIFVKNGLQVDAVVKPQIELGSTASTYEEYTGEAISVSWQDEAGTVYGGTLDVTTGTLTVDRAIVNAKDISWQKNSSQPNPNGAFFTASENVPFSGWNVFGWQSAISNVFVKASPIGNQNTEAANTFWWNNLSTGYRCIWGDASASTANDLIQFLTENNVVICAKLATPQTYQLTPQEVDTLVGQNNVWVDTGDVTAYVPDFTTEKVAGQSLSTTDGTNTVFVTSNVDPVSIEVEYAVAPDEE